MNFIKAVCFGMTISISGLVNVAFAGLIYDESVSGDTSPWYEGGVSLGLVNDSDYVLGSVVYEVAADIPQLWDGYNFLLNGTIETITIETINMPTSGVNGWQLYSGFVWLAPTIFTGVLNDATGTISYDVSGFSGEYLIGNNGASKPLVYDYTITFTGVTVPEPTTLAIFALGMMGLASRRFKKQS